MGPIGRRHFLLGAGALLATTLPSFAQPEQKVRRIGFLSPRTRPESGVVPAPFSEALRRAGYLVGKNLLIEARYTGGEIEGLTQSAEELVRLDVEIIVAVVNHASEAAWRATKNIPIVMMANMFPVERGLIASLARPGGNVTGTVWWARPNETMIKLYQILKEAVPNATRSAVLGDATDPQTRFYDLKKHDQLRAAMGLTHTRVPLARPEEFESALQRLVAARTEVIYVPATAVVTSRFREIAAFAIERKLVTISDSPTYLDAGGLLTYGPDLTELMDRTASYIDRILRGAKPGELPVEQASKYVLALNAKTARAIGFKPPPSFMVQVNRVVE